jgi:hypothetical protein
VRLDCLIVELARRSIAAGFFNARSAMSWF